MKKCILAGLASTFLFISCTKNEEDTLVSAQSTNSVKIKSSGFSPSYLEVNLNTSVVWRNDDNRSHSVIADDGTFNSGELTPGSNFSHMFTRVGGYEYHCGFHPGEEGMVNIIVIR